MLTIELIDGIFIHLLLVSFLIIYLLLDGERSFQAYYKYASGKSMRVRSIRSFDFFFFSFLFSKRVYALFFLTCFLIDRCQIRVKKSFKVCLEACPMTANCQITIVQNDKWKIKQLMHQSHLRKLLENVEAAN